MYQLNFFLNHFLVFFLRCVGGKFLFLSSIGPCKRLGCHFALHFNFFSLQSVALVGSSLEHNLLDSYIQQYAFAFVQRS